MNIKGGKGDMWRVHSGVKGIIKYTGGEEVRVVHQLFRNQLTVV